MDNQFYKVSQGFPPGGRWYLSDICDDRDRPIDTSVFFHAARLDFGPPARLPLVGGGDAELTRPPLIKLGQAGPRLEFTLGAFDLPIFSGRLADRVAPLIGDDVQRLPVRIDGQDDRFEVFNIVACRDCIDYDRSEIDWWEQPSDTPDAPQVPFAIYKLVIDPDTVGNSHIFRLTAVTTTIIVSRALKNVLEEVGGLGVRFIDV